MPAMDNSDEERTSTSAATPQTTNDATDGALSDGANMDGGDGPVDIDDAREVDGVLKLLAAVAVRMAENRGR